MSDGFKDKLDGAADKVKGEVKEGIGKLSGKKQKEMEGKFDKTKGGAKEKLGEVKDELNK